MKIQIEMFSYQTIEDLKEQMQRFLSNSNREPMFTTFAEHNQTKYASLTYTEL